MKCLSLLTILILTPLQVILGEVNTATQVATPPPNEVVQQIVIENPQGTATGTVVESKIEAPAYFPSPQSSPASPELMNTSGLIGQIFLYLGLIAFIGLLVIFITRRSSFPFRNKKLGSKLVISETRVLGNKQFLVVVEYGQKKLLLGVGPGMIKNLCLLSSEFDNGYAEKESSDT